MRLVILSMLVCVCVCVSVYTMTRHLHVSYTTAGTVAPSCENFYIGGDMHCHERLLVNQLFCLVMLLLCNVIGCF